MALFDPDRIKRNIKNQTFGGLNTSFPKLEDSITRPEPVSSSITPAQSYTNNIKTNIATSMAPKLEAPTPLTSAGSIYQQRVTENLLNPSPAVQGATQQAETNIARRNYLTRKQAQEDIAQSPFRAGSAQATRLMDQARAGANIANLGEQQALNQFSQGVSEQNLERARGLESDAYTKALGERTNEQIERGRYSSLIQDPKARYAYNRMVASGVQPSQAYQTVVGETGSIKEQYRGLTPIGTLQEDARQWVSAVTDFQEGTPEFEQAVRDRMVAIDEAQQEPLSDAQKQRQVQDILEKQRLGEELTSEEKQLLIGSGAAPQMTYQTIPRGKENVARWLEENPSGLVSIDGKLYQVQLGGRETTSYKDKVFGPDQPRHTDYVQVIDDEGNTKYIWNGAVKHRKPKLGD